MPKYHFISYSRLDAYEFSMSLQKALLVGDPPIETWLDTRDLKPGQTWPDSIADAISNAASFIFVITPASVDARSYSMHEVRQALMYRKLIIPLLVIKTDLPHPLPIIQNIDFTGQFDVGLNKLRTRLTELDTPAGQIEMLAYSLRLTKYEMDRASATERVRMQGEIDRLTQDIIDLKSSHQGLPHDSTDRAEYKLIKPEIDLYQAADELTNSTLSLRPPSAPKYFQDRFLELEMLEDFLKDESLRLMVVYGRGGVGKTILLSHLLSSLYKGALPDGQGQLYLDCIFYISIARSQGDEMLRVLSDLSASLPSQRASKLRLIFQSPQVCMEDKIEALLKEFNQRHGLIVLDHFEDIVDSQTAEVTEPDTRAFLSTLLKFPYQHSLKVIVASRIPLTAMASIEPGRQRPLPLDKGLPSPFAEMCLRQMDDKGLAGLKDADEELLRKLCERVRGFPHALVALYRWLAADYRSNLAEILNGTEEMLPDEVMEAVIGEAYKRLDSRAQKVIQALAIYKWPVSAEAVDYLLESFIPKGKSESILKRLVDMRFVQKVSGKYTIHDVDRIYVLSKTVFDEPVDQQSSAGSISTQYALFSRAADYFSLLRASLKASNKADDIYPYLAEFDLRCEAQDYIKALEVLQDVAGHLIATGDFRLAARSYERLEGKLNDLGIEALRLTNLGVAYSQYGRYEDAINCHEKVINLLEQVSTPDEKAILEFRIVNFVSLGGCYLSLGEMSKAIFCLRRAGQMARKSGNKDMEVASLGNMGICYAEMGNLEAAARYYNRAVNIARIMGNSRTIGECEINLGNAHADLGDYSAALRSFKRALKITLDTQNKEGEATVLHSLSEVMIDQRQYDDAIEYATQALGIAEEIGSPKIMNEAYRATARAELLRGNLSSALTACQSAIQYHSPRYEGYVLLLSGLIKLKQGELVQAEDAFDEAINVASEQLKKNDKEYKALDVKGLALCGLALSRDYQHIPKAIRSFRQARRICKAPGVINRVLDLFEQLATADQLGLLARVRAAITKK